MLVSQQNISLPEEQRATSLGDLQLFKLLLQPHFLFNSLNNIYALSVKRSDLTTEAIAGLSELLENVVACSRQEYIPLTQELKLVEDYIRLERIWLGETSFLLDFQVSGDTSNFLLPPLVLYTFVENCFKHGIRKCAGDGWLTIKVEVKKGTLYFSAKNLVPKWAETSDSGTERSGFGIEAAKELLKRKCKGNHELSTGRKGNVFTVKLKIACPENSEQEDNEPAYRMKKLYK